MRQYKYTFSELSATITKRAIWNRIIDKKKSNCQYWILCKKIISRIWHVTNDGQVDGTSDNRWEEEKYNIGERDKRNWTCEIRL